MKPRLRFNGLWWICRSPGHQGIGLTMQGAYFYWRLDTYFLPHSTLL